MSLLLLLNDGSDPRHEQMRALASALVEGDDRHVVLHGAPGSGKTSLARAFLQRYSEQFTGGSYFLDSSLYSPLTIAILTMINRHRRGLVVLDAIDSVPVQALTDFLAFLRSDFPKTRVLMTSRGQVHPTRETTTIEMPPLGLAQVLEILRSDFTGDSDQLTALAVELAGNATAVELISQRLAAGMPPQRILEWLDSGRLPVARGPEGQPLDGQAPQRRQLDIALTEVSDELIRHLADQPHLLYELDPRKFEQLVAELYRRRGYEAMLTPASGDHGVDVYVVSRDGVGETLWVVQAKRWAAHRKVGAGVVRELYGTVNMAHASAGILLTTSFFEPGAHAIERELRYRIKLGDYLALQDLLRSPPRRSGWGEAAH